LKPIVLPTFTLMSVANPWIVVSPAPLMSQIAGSVPGLLFSQAILFELGPQGSVAAEAGEVGIPMSTLASNAIAAIVAVTGVAIGRRNMIGRVAGWRVKIIRKTVVDMLDMIDQRVPTGGMTTPTVRNIIRRSQRTERFFT
jgi:hypothetical protein